MLAVCLATAARSSPVICFTQAPNYPTWFIFLIDMNSVKAIYGLYVQRSPKHIAFRNRAKKYNTGKLESRWSFPTEATLEACVYNALISVL